MTIDKGNQLTTGLRESGSLDAPHTNFRTEAGARLSVANSFFIESVRLRHMVEFAVHRTQAGCPASWPMPVLKGPPPMGSSASPIHRFVSNANDLQPPLRTGSPLRYTWPSSRKLRECGGDPVQSSCGSTAGILCKALLTQTLASEHRQRVVEVRSSEKWGLSTIFASATPLLPVWTSRRKSVTVPIF